MNKWISVEDKLPAIKLTQIPRCIRDDVIFVTRGGDKYIGYCVTFCGDEDSRKPEWYAINRYKDGVEFYVYIYDVTYWMNIPELLK